MSKFHLLWHIGLIYLEGKFYGCVAFQICGGVNARAEDH